MSLGTADLRWGLDPGLSYQRSVHGQRPAEDSLVVRAVHHGHDPRPIGPFDPTVNERAETGLARRLASACMQKDAVLLRRTHVNDDEAVEARALSILDFQDVRTDVTVVFAVRGRFFSSSQASQVIRRAALTY